MKRFMLTLSLAALCCAAASQAQVPQTISYQGVLTDGAGNMVADGPYSFTFKIYDVAVAGAALWTETQPAVAVVRAGFSVILGSVTPITLPFDKQYWLGVSVGGGPELTPRVQLASSPYGLSLRLPFNGSASSAGPALGIKNTGGGPDIAADHLLTVGNSTTTGTLNWYLAGSASPIGSLYDWGPWGGAIDLYDQFGSPFWALQPDFQGGSAYLNITSPGGGLTLDGNSGATGDPLLAMYGSGSSFSLNTNASGDAALSLPTSSVDANEILDEPGIAQGINGSLIAVGASMTDFVSVTITTPAAGYIFLTANAMSFYQGDGLNHNFAYLQITETPGGPLDGTNYRIVGAYPFCPTYQNYSTATVNRTYLKAAGTYTFYFQGYANNPAGTLNDISLPTLTATYFPTSYGSVTTIVSGAERAQFSHAQPVAIQASGPIVGSSDGAIVDLRELELKAARAQADAEKAQRLLIEARAKEQLKMGARPAAAPKK